MSKISKISGPIKSWVFPNVKGTHVRKFVLDHETQHYEKWVPIQTDGSDITVITDDEWTRETETWLQHEDESLTGPGIPVSMGYITYLVGRE